MSKICLVPKPPEQFRPRASDSELGSDPWRGSHGLGHSRGARRYPHGADPGWLAEGKRTRAWGAAEPAIWGRGLLHE